MNREIKLKINERTIIICAFNIIIIKNIFVQANNDNFFCYFACIKYRTCLYFKKKKILNFNIINKSRYYYKIIKKRKKLMKKDIINKKIKIFCKKKDLQKKFLTIIKLISIFDIIVIKTYNVFYFE